MTRHPYHLRAIDLKNFKSIAAASVNLKPLTVLVGTNSSGKSSLLQAIRVISQALQSDDLEIEFPLNGESVKLGTFKEARTLGCTNPSDPIHLGVTVSLSDQEANGDTAIIAWSLDLHRSDTEDPGIVRIGAIKIEIDEPSKSDAESRRDSMKYVLSNIRADSTLWTSAKGFLEYWQRLGQYIEFGVAQLTAEQIEAIRLSQTSAALGTSESLIYSVTGSLESRGMAPSLLQAASITSGIPQRLFGETTNPDGIVRQVTSVLWDSAHWSYWNSLGSQILTDIQARMEAGGAVEDYQELIGSELARELELMPQRKGQYVEELRDDELDSLLLKLGGSSGEDYILSNHDLFENSIDYWITEPVDRALAVERAADYLRSKSVDEILGRRIWPDDERYENAAIWSSLNQLGKREFVDALVAECSDDEWVQHLLSIGSRLDGFVEPLRIPGWSRLVSHFSQMKSVLRDRIRYLGPLRQPPGQFHDQVVGSRHDLGPAGERAATVLRSDGRTTIDMPMVDGSLESRELSSALDYWLREMGLADSASVADWGRFGVALQVRPTELESSVDLTAVGVGVSQVLPVLMVCLRAKPGDIVVLEQPELHLHPALQMKLADFLLACTRSGRQLIVETHSEHLVNRLRRWAAEDDSDEISPLVGLLFAQRDDEGLTSFRATDINPLGGLSEDWPDGFLDVGAREAQGLLLAGLAKHQRRKPSSE